MDKRADAPKQTFGIGYATVIMIFVVICLSIFALLSYNAAGINSSLSANNRSYITSYYSAEERAAEKIAALDEAAYKAHEDLFFADAFEAGASAVPDTAIAKVPDGYEVSFSEKINDRLTLSVKMIFYSDPLKQGGKRYTIEEYKTKGVSDTEVEHIGIWDGKTPIGA